MDLREFERIVVEEFAKLPRAFAEPLRQANVAILVQDWPSDALLLQMEIAHREDLLGFYEGIPLPDRDASGPMLPDRILLFRMPILASARGADVREEIRATLYHEIAHFFGIDDDRLEEIDAY